MSKFTELQILKAEERIMIGILGRMGDQLNRLKVEELALMSQIRTSQEESQESNSINADADPSAASTTDITASLEQPLVESPWLEDKKPLPVLELRIPHNLGGEEEEEEEEEDEDEEEDDDMDDEPESAHDQLTAFLQQLQANNIS